MVASADVLAVIAAYLCGSLPFAYLLVRRGTGADLRQIGNGNVGARNAIRMSGLRWGLAVLALDVLKGAGAYLLYRLLSDSVVTLYLCGLAVLLGHWFPVWLKGRGGVGQAAASGFFIAMWPVPGAIAVAVFLAALASSRIWNAAYVLAALVYLWTSHRGGSPWQEGVFFVLVMLATLAKKLIDEPRQRRIKEDTRQRKP